MTVLAGTLLLLFCSAAFGQDDGKQQPRTVTEAVSTLLKTIPVAEKDYLLEMPEERLIDLHFGLGLYIRNFLIRHGGVGGGYNKELVKSCAKEAEEDEEEMHIDGCSGIIIGALWNKLRNEADPALVKDLDEQYSLLNKIEIKNRNYRQKNLGEIIDDINLQLTDLLVSIPARSDTAGKLMITTTPSIDLTAHRGSDFIAYRDFLGADSIPLLKLLEWLEEHYWLRMKRQPPQIIFDVVPRR